MRKNKKIAVSLISISALLTSLIFPIVAQAYSFPIDLGLYSGDIEIPQSTVLQIANDVAKKTTVDLEDRYGIDTDMWRRAQRKSLAPRVEISFDNTNPKAGEKVTAHAVPEFFKNDPQNLYFTWYLIHTDPKEAHSDINTLGATNSIEAGKREAAKIIARGDYDSSLDNPTYDDSNAEPDRDGWPTIDSSYSSDENSAPMGGADGVGGLPEGSSRIEPYESSGEYCSTHGSHSDNSLCDKKSEHSNFNQYYNLKSSQGNYYCDKCQSSLPIATSDSFNRCCYLEYNPDDTLYEEYQSATNYCTSTFGYSSASSVCVKPYANITNYENNLCCYNVSPPIDPNDSPNPLPYSSSTDYCPASYDPAYDACYDWNSMESANKSAVDTCLQAKYNSCKNDWNNSERHSDPSGNEPVTQVSRCYKHNFGVNQSASGFRGYDTTGDDGSGTDAVTDCIHKWKDAKTPECTADDCVSGSGKFPTGEEKYWGTDPNDPDTDGDGFPDEADVIGLGQESFTWTYQPGDRVGVVVEGTSMIPVDEKSAYYKIMWGYMDICDGSKKDILAGDECNDDGDYGYGFLATKAPSDEYSEEKIKASLNFSPDTPIVDPTSDETMSDADEITVYSSIDNTELKPQNLYYTWYIQKKGASGEWARINDLENSFDLSTESSGMGVSSFSFKPKRDFMKSLSDDLVNLRVSVAISRTADPTIYEENVLGRTTPRSGFASVEVPINKKGIKIKLYKVGIEGEKAKLGEEICDKKSPFGVYCPAVKNQMMAAGISSNDYSTENSKFSWSLNGDPLYQPLDFSVFDNWSSTTDPVVYFPVTKNAQDIENISVTVTPNNVLQAVTTSRSIIVTNPAVYIRPLDYSLSWPKQYLIESKNQPDFSYLTNNNSVFEAEIDNSPYFNLSSIPDYLIYDDNASIDWAIDGVDINDPDFDGESSDITFTGLANNNRTIYLNTSIIEGASSTLEATFKKYWNDAERNVLYTAWGIQPETLEGKTSIEIENVAEIPLEEDEDTYTLNSSKQILAAIGTHLPQYAMYILRLSLTLVIMFFVSIFFYSLTQKISLYEDKQK